MNHRGDRQLGNYRLIHLLGQGGFAEVYLGEHVHLKTQAAIKVLKGQMALEDIHGFTKEAQTVAKLKHPHILRVLDFGIDEQIPFLVMEYAPNGTLRQLHPRGSRVPLPTIVSYVKQVASALQTAHDAKLIHRDVKPENMLVGSDNTILLSDFGIAAGAHSTTSMKTLDQSGTPHYMAPEQFQGKPRPSSDQYALAIVVYEWLCGQRPFSGSSIFELCWHHVADSPPSLRGKNISISPEVEQVVFTALAKNPQQRFATIQAFAQALAAAVGHVDQVARTPTIEVKHLSGDSPSPPLASKAPQKSQLTELLPLLWEGDDNYKHRRYNEAITTYSSILTITSKNAEVYYKRGNAYAALGQYQQAIADYDCAISLGPQEAKVYGGRGLVYYELRDYQRAVSDFDHARQLDSSIDWFHFQRDDAYRRLKGQH